MVFWLDEDSPSEVYIYVIRHDGEHFLTRTINTKDVTTESKQEATAIILRFTIHSILEDRLDTDSIEDVPETPVADDDQAPEDEMVIGLDAAISYGFGFFAGGPLLIHGPRFA